MGSPIGKHRQERHDAMVYGVRRANSGSASQGAGFYKTAVGPTPDSPQGGYNRNPMLCQDMSSFIALQKDFVNKNNTKDPNFSNYDPSYSDMNVTLPPQAKENEQKMLRMKDFFNQTNSGNTNSTTEGSGELHIQREFGGRKDNTTTALDRPDGVKVVQFEVSSQLFGPNESSDGGGGIIGGFGFGGGGGSGGGKNAGGGTDIFVLQRPNDYKDLDENHTQCGGQFYSVKFRYVGFWRKVQNGLFLQLGKIYNSSGNESSNSVVRPGSPSSLSRNRILIQEQIDSENNSRTHPTKTLCIWCTGKESLWENPSTKTYFKLLEGQGVGDLLPLWLRPACFSTRLEKDGVTQFLFECAVCYFPLCCAGASQGGVCCMRDQGRRICPHYIHSQCGEMLLQNMKAGGLGSKGKSFFGSREHRKHAECPLCGGHFNEIKPLPDPVKDPRGWFQCVDVDRSGSLDQREVIEALGASFPLPRQELKLIIHDHWFEWDRDGNGVISLREMVSKSNDLRENFNTEDSNLLSDNNMNSGMMGKQMITNPAAMRGNTKTFQSRGLQQFIKEYLVQYCNSMMSRDNSNSSSDLRSALHFLTNPDEIPSLESHPDLWFEYWDSDNSGTLEYEELERALIRSTCIGVGNYGGGSTTSNVPGMQGEVLFNKAFNMKLLARNLWEDCGFRHWDQVDFETFMEVGGLCDTLMHNMVHGQIEDRNGWIS